MREILFRGKRVDDGKWIKGSLIIQKNKEHSIWCNDYPFGINIVERETVGQYTNLIDKNNRYIFEGDILRLTDTINDIEFTALVEFGNPNCEYNWGFQLVKISGDGANKDILLWCCMEDVGVYAEIIGNIYDNPELLKGAN